MAKQSINVGTTANDKKGDSLRLAFQKVNANFTELYTALGLNSDGTLNLGAFEFSGSTISTTDSSAIVIDQATTITSNLTVGGDILPQTANGGDLGSLARPFRSLYVSNSTVYFGGVPLSIEPGSNTLKINNVPLSETANVPTDVADLTDDDGLLGGGVADLARNIESEGDVSIRVNLTDSTTRIWRFGEDGNLTFPDGTNYSGNNITVLSGGIPTGIANLNSNGGWNTPPYTNLATTGGTGSGLTVNAASNAGNGYLDTIAINTAGTGYTDGDVITITNENSLTATFTISTSYTWTLNTNGRTTFPNGVVPAHSYGAAGDKEGMVVFDDTYIYYCTADYVDNVTDIWKRTAHGAGTW